MPNEFLPIQFFAKRKEDESRVEGGGNSENPKFVLKGRELEMRAKRLAMQFDGFKNSLELNPDIPFVFKAQLTEKAVAKSHRAVISSFFATNKNNVIGLDHEDLMVKLESIKDFGIISKRINDIENNDYAISCLDNLQIFEPCIIEGSTVDYKVKLINFGDYEYDRAIRRRLTKLLEQNGIQSQKVKYSYLNYIFHIKVQSENKLGAILDTLKDSGLYGSILAIEPMPLYKIVTDSMGSNESCIVISPDAVKKYATLGILDSGIGKINHLKNWIIDHYSPYPEQYLDQGHGTFVAGVALYGDYLEGNTWIGSSGFKLLDAAIFPSEGIYEDDLIFNIREAVKTHNKDVNIWNLSISIIGEIEDDKFSDFAIALDDIQAEYNILICKSAGNCSNYIQDKPKMRLTPGADSVRSLVVGSLAHVDSNLAKFNNPSPFSRIGSGPVNIIKPEVVHYGGNVGIDKNNRTIWHPIKSFDCKDGIVERVGTSFSTPRIAALAVSLEQEIDIDFDPLLIKALILHSAYYPDELEIPKENRTQQVGFGLTQSVQNILYNSPNEITLILSDTLAKGEFIDIKDFPMPDSLINDEGYFEGQIFVTLVCNPILEAGQGIEYCQSDIDVKLGTYDSTKDRDTTKKTILNPIGREGTINILKPSLYSRKVIKADTYKFARERTLINYGKYSPVKKYAVDLSELTESNKINSLASNKKWFLALKGIYRDFVENSYEEQNLQQDFCLIITIRDKNGKAPVYTDVSRKLDIEGFWHRNIQLTSTLKYKGNN